MWREASAAKRIIRTAPTAKFGAMTMFAGPPSASARSSATWAVAQAGRADDGVDARAQGVAGVAEDDVGLGEVDDDVEAAGRSSAGGSDG